MMTDHEQMMVFAERYVLGERAYIVSDTVNYIAMHIDGMTEYCKHVMIEDIKHLLGGDHCDEFDEKEWLWLLKKLEGDNNG